MADDGFVFHVDLTSIMLFASCLGESNRIYYDDEYAGKTPLGGVIAPPSFPTSASHWNPRAGLRGVRRIPARPESKVSESSEAEAGQAESKPQRGGGNLARVLHGEQRFQYHQPIRPGMKLRVTTRPGKSWSKEGKRGGTLDFRESVTEYRDENGELVCTGTSVGITTSKAVEND